MAEISQVLVKDLLSTGYFFEELRNYSKSTEMTVYTYSRNYAIPYLIKRSASHRGPGQPGRNKILDSAVDLLSDANDDELIESIFALKKIARSEIQTNEKLLSEIGRHNKSEVLNCYHEFESAECLLKLIVNIIKIFKLPEVIASQDQSGAAVKPMEDR